MQASLRGWTEERSIHRTLCEDSTWSRSLWYLSLRRGLKFLSCLSESSLSAFISKTRWKVVKESLIEAKNLRTLNYACENYDGDEIEIDFSNHLRLRTLDFEFSLHVPKCIGKMKHLRYINFTHCYFDFLPKVVTKLYHLETLIIRGCFELRELPSDITSLINLRHLDIKSSNKYLSYMPKGMGSMTTFQTMNLKVLVNRPLKYEHKTMTIQTWKTIFKEKKSKKIRDRIQNYHQHKYLHEQFNKIKIEIL